MASKVSSVTPGKASRGVGIEVETTGRGGEGGAALTGLELATLELAASELAAREAAARVVSAD